MLYKDDKQRIEYALMMFSEDFTGEDLIKQTARYISANITTWKRKLVYDYTRACNNKNFEIL